MAIEIPHEVAQFLNFIGVPYPDINEDQVRELATQVRTFADDVSGTHQAATGTITDMGSVYQGQSYRALVASWASLSASHMERLDELCRAVARALEIAAEVITVVKVAVLTELALLAAAYTATMAATIATSGASAAVGQTISLAAKRLIKAMEEMLVAYIVAEVLGKAIEPLEAAVSDMISGVVYNAAADLLGVDGGGNDSLYIDPDEVRRYAQVLDDHADDIVKHAEKFAKSVADLDFTTPVAQPGPAGAPGGTQPTPVDGTRGPAAVQHGGARVPSEVPVAPRNWIPTPMAAAESSLSAPPADPGHSTTPVEPAKGGAVSAAGEPGTAGSRGGSANSAGAGSSPAGMPAADPATAGMPAADSATGGMPVTESLAAGTPPAEVRGERPPIVEAPAAAAGPAPVDREAGQYEDVPVAAREHPAGHIDVPGQAAASMAEAASDARAEESAEGAGAAPGSAPPAGQGTQSSPWNRQAPGSGAGGPDDSARGGRTRRRGADGGRAGRTAGGRRRRAVRPNPWAARPAGGPQPATTPWARPAEKSTPPPPAVAAAGDTPPPTTSEARSRSATRESAGVETNARDQVVSAPSAAVDAPAVSAPARADEGPPPRG
ncbi:hypothetical protein [Nocardia grenadensis]|uniref:WXG100-like domain-containing protein n=1 Tax=Nocardia grenadensis TaxID=931537 RepID=UPI003D943092